jgi:hypothetical protein
MELYTCLTADILEYSGSFTYDFGVTREFKLSDELNFSIDFNTGCGNKKFTRTYINPEANKGSLNYAALTLSSSYYFNQNFYLKPHIENYRILSSILREISGNSLWNFGVAVGVEI